MGGLRNVQRSATVNDGSGWVGVNLPRLGSLHLAVLPSPKVRLPYSGHNVENADPFTVWFSRSDSSLGASEGIRSTPESCDVSPVGMTDLESAIYCTHNSPLFLGFRMGYLPVVDSTLPIPAGAGAWR